MRLQITQDGDYIVVDGNDNDALKITENYNGTLELTFLSTGAWSAGQKRLYGDRKTTVGIEFNKNALSVQETVHPSKDFNADHDWHYREDPYPYITGLRGLSIATSAERASDKIMNDLWDGVFNKGDEDKLYAICGTVLEDGAGRNYLYRVAGRVRNGLKDRLVHTDAVSAFKAYVELDGYEA
jgi:hypothetical protein